MTFTIPDDMRPTLATLFQAREKAEETMAACALEAWRLHFSQPLAGLSAPTNKATIITHFDAILEDEVQTAFSPVFVWRNGPLVALLFADQSGLVTREIEGRLQALPCVFKLRKQSVRPDTSIPVIRSKYKPEAQVSFRQFKDETNLAKYSASDPNIRSRPGAEALRDLEEDLLRLSPLFADLPRIIQPQDRAPCPDQDGITLPFLPQRWFSDAEKAACETWVRDLADWILLEHPEFSSVNVGVSSRRPKEIDRPHVLTGPFQYHFRYRDRPPHGVRDGFGDIEDLFDDPERLAAPIPASRLCSLTFKPKGLRRHSVTTPKVASHGSKTTPSKHRAMQLLARFGRSASAKAA